MLRITVATKTGDIIQVTKETSVGCERNRILDWFDAHEMSCYAIYVNDHQQYIIPIENVDSISLEEWDELDE